MSHEGRIRRGKEEKERGLDTADTRYFDEKAADGHEDTELTTEQLKKKEKKSLTEKIKGIFKSKKNPEEQAKAIQEEMKAEAKKENPDQAKLEEKNK